MVFRPGKTLDFFSVLWLNKLQSSERKKFFMNIITLTLNPAYDLHCHVPSFHLFRENHGTVTSRDPGGKGINISRALLSNGIESLAVVAVGSENGEDYLRSLRGDGVRVRAFFVPGRIRENLTIHCDGSEETRLSFAGFTVDENLLIGIETLFRETIGVDTVLTVTGSLPDGLSKDSVKAFLRGCSSKGAKIVIDSRSFSLNDLLELKPWLIKPNQEEVSVYSAGPAQSFKEVSVFAGDLHRQGISNVMVSLGAKGALLVCDEGSFLARPPKICAVSTIGAGDSSIAGFLSVFGPSSLRLRSAVAFGTASCLTPGTRPPRSEDVQALLPQVILEKYE